MPIYEFTCTACGERFEELMAAGTSRAACPACGAGRAERAISQVSPPARIGLRGAAARRSDAERRAREDRRRERAAEQREKRA